MLTLLPAFVLSATVVAAEAEVDVLVYGGTSGGVAAAVQCRLLGKLVRIIEPGHHLGGLTAGGLGATDIGNKGAIGGLARQFYRAVKAHYLKPESWFEGKVPARVDSEDAFWTFEPHVAEGIFRQWVAEHQIPVAFGQRLDLKHGVEKQGNRLLAVYMETGEVYRAKMFIDASYEGDLLALAGVSFTVGREANAQYGETLNGVQVRNATKHQFKAPVDPYVVPGNPSSGLLPGVQADPPGAEGAADQRVQAYNFRMCLTDRPEIRLPWPKPAGYEPLRYELLLRYIQAGHWDALHLSTMMPNRKTDTNNHGAFSTDNIGRNYDYPNADYATRARIIQDHVTYQQGLFYFLATDPRVPDKVRADVTRWGPAKDEFLDNGHWPHQLYVREARRMVADLVMTQHHCQGREIAPQPVGLAAYTMDSHNVQRYVDDKGHARNEGDVQVGGFPPYPIGYASIVPKMSECQNLLVPVCLSASHIAYGSIRMEPVFMVLGQSAATAAALALEAQLPVQQIDTSKLRERLLADQQVLEWTGPRSAPKIIVAAASLPGQVIEPDAEAVPAGWTHSDSIGPYVGSGYLHDGDVEKGRSLSVTFAVPKAGRYEIRLAYTANPNRATNVKVTVDAATGPATHLVNQRKPPAIDRLFHRLGIFEFQPTTPGKVTVDTTATDGYVVFDAVQVVPAE